MSKVIIFNMTPRSGKDTAVDALHEKFGWTKLSFKEKLIDAALAHYDISREEWDERYNKWDEGVGWYKDLSWNRLGTGLRVFSQREALIHISETVMKPLFGEGIFGKAVADDIGFDGTYLISDGGFDAELHELIEFEHDILVIKRDRLGQGWEGDSRDWLDTDLPKTTEVWVPEEIEEVDEYLEFVSDTVLGWLSSRGSRPRRGDFSSTLNWPSFGDIQNHTLNRVFN